MTAEHIRFLSIGDVLTIHSETIECEGGELGLRDVGLLDAAISMPRQAFDGVYLHPDLHAMATAYLYHLCCNHPFVDGNKRVALSCALVFLIANGVEKLPDNAETYRVTMAVADGSMSKAELTVWFEQLG